MCFDNDLTYNDFNPTVFYVCKKKRTSDGEFHHHEHTEIKYILSGKNKCLINNIEYDVEAGDLIVINPGVEHTFLSVDSKEPVIEFITGFDNFHFKNMAPNSIELPDKSPILHTTADLKQDISKLIYSMIAERESNQIGMYFMLKTQLMQLLLLLIREIGHVENTDQKGCSFDTYTKNYAVNRIINYLNENYEHKISLEQIAHNMYLSPVYISKIFKEETGESPINYLIKIRLEKARDILLNENRGSIKDIANRVGYDDVYHFSKLFKKYYGISPLNYKKEAIDNSAANE